MLPIFMISLAQDTDRRAASIQQFKALNLSFEVFDALRGNEGATAFDRIDGSAFTLHTGRKYTPGEIGCFASHKTLWQRCIEQDRAIMIMEDDFLLTPEFPDAVRAAATLIDDLGLVRLQDERRGESIGIIPVGDFQLERYTKTPHCTLCYAISPAIARRLVNLHRDFRAPVDVVLKHVWQYRNPMYCLTPYTVSSSALSYESVISGREKCAKSLPIRLRRFWLKSNWQWRRLLFNLQQDDDWIRQHFGHKGNANPARH